MRFRRVRVTHRDYDPTGIYLFTIFPTHDAHYNRISENEQLKYSYNGIPDTGVMVSFVGTVDVALLVVFPLSVSLFVDGGSWFLDVSLHAVMPKSKNKVRSMATILFTLIKAPHKKFYIAFYNHM